MGIRARLVELGCRCADSGMEIALPSGQKARIVPGLTIDGKGATCVGCERTTPITAADYRELGAGA